MDPDVDAVLERVAVVRARLDRLLAHATTDDLGPDGGWRGLHVSDRQARASLARLSPTFEPGLGPTPSPASRLGRLGLDPLDLDLLVLALAPDVDPRLEVAIGYLHDDLTRRRPSVGLCCALLGVEVTDPDVRSRLSPGSTLLLHGFLLVPDDERPFPSRSVRAHDRVVDHLLGCSAVEEVLRPFVRSAPVMDDIAGSSALRLAADGSTVLVHLRDRAGLGPSYAATLLAAAGMGALVLDLGAVPDDLLVAVAASAVREAALWGAGLVLLGLDALPTRPGGRALVRRFADAPATVVAVGGTTWDPAWAARVPLTLDTPGRPPSGVLSSFRLTPDGMTRAVAAATLLARASGSELGAEHLAAGARAQNSAGLERLARHVRPKAGWSDLVLPRVQLEQLHELVGRVAHRERVVDDWGMGGAANRGAGVTALFTGDSGTGKTMSAEVVAGALGLDLYVVDLATVVDKYIGETEKHLDRIFDEAERINGVLLFDEADAIFGKRSDVGDAKDRYANVEVAYLLQRMERFEGIAILTTNLRANLDDAFLRRLDVLIEFPTPDAAARRQLWLRHLPDRLPLSDDLDIGFLAEAFEVSGGNIRNIAMAAAFLAASADRPVGMEHLTRATDREYRKLGRLRLDSEFGPYHELATSVAGGRDGSR